MLTRVVNEWQVRTKLFTIEPRVHIPVEDTHYNDWPTCEDDIVELNVPFVEDCHGAEATEVGVEIVRHRQNHVLVEKVQDKLRDARITSSTMKEDEAPEHLELRNRKVTGLDGSHALVTKKANTDVRFIDHAYIVVTIAHGHCQQTAIVHLDHLDDISFLLG